MSKLGIKYDGCQEVIESLTRISNCTYIDLAEDLREVLSSLNSLKNKPSTGSISSAISNAEENANKLREFAAGLQSYAEKLYEFDNTFYNNFVLLDGTNYDKYQSNISSINISDAKIKGLLREEDKKSVEALVVALMRIVKRDLASDPSILKEIQKEINKFGLSEGNSKSLSLIFQGISFEITTAKATKDKFITLKNKNLDINDVKKCAQYLHDELGILNDSELLGILNDKSNNSTRQAKKFIDKVFSEEGAKVYDKSKNQWSKYSNKLLKSNYDDLNNYITGAQKGWAKNLGDIVKDTAKDDLLGEVKYIKENFNSTLQSVKGKTVIKDVKNLKWTSKLEFAGKAVGVVDKVKTINDNVKDNLKDEQGNWNITGDTVKEFTVDTSVDLAASAGAAATGAAIGSFVPVVGTIVGAGIGAGIGIFINHKFIGDPKESLVDKTKDLANKGVDKIGENIGKIFW